MAKTRLSHNGWLLVADGEKALFLYNAGDEKYPNLKVFREMAQQNPPDREQGTDRPGRLHDASEHHRSSVEETDWHRIAKERFAGEIAERLYKQAHAGRFDQLVIVAPPRILSALRKELHVEVASRVTAEIDKDLTNHPVYEIEKHVLVQEKR